MISLVSATDTNITTENYEVSADNDVSHNTANNTYVTNTDKTNIVKNEKITTENKKTDNNTVDSKIDTVVSIDSINSGKYDENVSVIGKFTTSDGKKISNSNVRLFINGVKYLSKTDKTGTYNFTTKVTTVGINNLTVGYGGNNKYNPYETNTTFTVDKQDVIITYNSIDDTLYKNNVTISGKFTDVNGKAITNSNVRIFINGVKYLSKTDKTGTYNFTTEAKTLGVNNISVGYGGNAKYNTYETNTTFIVKKQDVIVTYNSIEDVMYKNNVTITGKFLNQNGKAISNSNVRIFLNGKKYLSRTDATGTYIFTFEATTLGVNNISIGYGGNDKYYEYESNTTFNVIKNNVTVTYDIVERIAVGENYTITGKFLNQNGKAISNSNVRIFINGVKYLSRTDKTGTYTLTQEASIIGVNNITVGYGGNDKYYEYESNTTIEVFEKIDPDIRLASSDINPGKVKTFFALFPYDATGNVRLIIDDTIIGDNVELEYGQLLYRYQIPEDYQSERYTLYLIYSGDSIYKNKTLNVTLTLTPVGGKINATMNMDNFTVKYSLTENLTVTLNENAFGTIKFAINNTNVSESVNFTNGTCVLNYTAQLDPGVYNLTATYTGNYMYQPAIINSTLRINKLGSTISTNNISAKAGNITQFAASVTDELGNQVNKMKVEFLLNETVIGSNNTNYDGIAYYNYKLPPTLYEKTYTITTRSIETKTISNNITTATLTLLQLKTRVYVPDISTIPSRYVTVTASIVDEFNNSVTKGNITFKKDNTTIAEVPVDNGYAKFQYESNYETATMSHIYATFIGDWKYSNSAGNGTYKVTKLKTTLVSSSLDGKSNSEIMFTAKVMDETQSYVNEGNVTFTLAGKVLGTMEVSKGNARLKYNLKDYGVGEYKIECEYHGSPVYKESSSISMLRVTRYTTTIKGNPINAVVGTTTNITVNVIDDEKYNVESGTVNFNIGSEYIGSANVSNGYATLEYLVPSKYDGKTLKYYATYVKNDIYDSSSFSETIVVSHQNEVYVSPKGNDNNLGDKTHPFKTLEHAIKHITLFGTIHLDSGTYNASGITLNSSITIIGNGRDTTFINGMKTGKPIFNMSKRNVVLTLDGVTIMNGKSNKEFSAGAIVTSGKLTITNSRFVNNTCSGNYSGGAIYTNGILNVTNTEFISNSVTNVNSQGGAIRTYNNITYITDCLFESNKVSGNNSTGASVLYIDSGDIIINSTTFNKNSVTNGKYVTGGVIRAVASAIVIDNSRFTNNKIKATDYGIGGVIGSLSSGISIMNSKFNSNTVEATNSGGAAAIYIETAVLEIKNSELRSNKITSKEAYGGAIYGFKAFVTLEKSTISYNNIIGSNNGFGGALYAYEGNFNITNVDFTNNTIRAGDMALGGVLYSDSNVTIINSNLTNNNINASNLGGGSIANMGNLTITNTNLINNYAYDAGNEITATDTAVNNIENNYWNSATPDWEKLLNGVTQPKSFSTTKLDN